LITGAAGGIGRAIAEALAARGAAVAVGDVREADARAAADAIAALGGRAIAVGMDVRRVEDVRAGISAAVGHLGRLDILVNSAGLQYVAPVQEYPEEKWDELMGVMVTGTFLCTKYALPHMMRERWGRVVNLSSIHGLIASPFKSAYTAAKHAVIGFTKGVALEVAEHGVTVNAICPTYTRTPLVMNQIASLASEHGLTESEVVETIMLAPAAVKRMLSPQEVAALAVFLCGDAAGAITGAAYTIDGGWTAR
jgi:3-hydroxybutyrate dehydrogenase